MSQEQRTQQGRDMCAIGVGVRQDTDLAVTQPGQVIHTGIDTDCDGDIMHFLRSQHLGRVHFPGIQYFAAQRHDGLKRPVTRLLGRTTGRIAFYQKQFGTFAVCRGTVRQFAR